MKIELAFWKQNSQCKEYKLTFGSDFTTLLISDIGSDLSNNEDATLICTLKKSNPVKSESNYKSIGDFKKVIKIMLIFLTISKKD